MKHCKYCGDRVGDADHKDHEADCKEQLELLEKEQSEDGLERLQAFYKKETNK